MLLSDPVLQKLNGRPVAEGRVLSFSVVKNLDVFKGRRLDLGVSCCRPRLPPQPRDGEVPFIRWAPQDSAYGIDNV